MPISVAARIPGDRHGSNRAASHIADQGHSVALAEPSGEDQRHGGDRQTETRQGENRRLQMRIEAEVDGRPDAGDPQRVERRDQVAEPRGLVDPPVERIEDAGRSEQNREDQEK